MKTHNIVITIIALLVVGVGGFWLYRRSLSTAASTTANLQLGQVVRGPLVTSVNAAGAIAAPQSETLVWKATGTVGAIDVAVGEVVTAGQQLMTLNPASLAPAILQAQADLVAAQENLATIEAGPTAQQLAQAQLAVVQAQQALTTAQKNLTNALNPVGQGLLDQVQQTQLALQTAQTNLQLVDYSTNVAALQNQVYVTNWYRQQLEQAQANLAANPADPDSLSKLQVAQNNYDSQLGKQTTLELTINSDKANKSNTVDNAQTAYDTAAANLKAAQAGPNQTKVELYQAQLAVAQANLLQVQADLAELQAGPDQQAILAAQAKIAAAQATVDSPQLPAPFAGTVVAIYNRVGDIVGNNENAILLADLSALQIQVSVAEVDINQVAVGQLVNLTADAAPGLTFQGQVAAVLAMGQTQQNVTTFPVTVIITQTDPALKPGMTAAVSIVTSQRAEVLLVPNRAIRVSAGQRTVTVLFEGQQIPVPVTIGQSNETQSEVVQGQLQEGDSVVLNVATTPASNGGGGGFGGFFGGGGGGVVRP